MRTSWSWWPPPSPVAACSSIRFQASAFVMVTNGVFGISTRAGWRSEEHGGPADVNVVAGRSRVRLPARGRLPDAPGVVVDDLRDGERSQPVHQGPVRGLVHE